MPLHGTALPSRKQAVAIGGGRPVIHEMHDEGNVEAAENVLDQRHHTVAAEDRIEHRGLEFGDLTLECSRNAAAFGKGLAEHAKSEPLYRRLQARLRCIGAWSGPRFRAAPRLSPEKAAHARERFSQVDLCRSQPIIETADVVARWFRVIVYGEELVRGPAPEQIGEGDTTASDVVEGMRGDKEEPRVIRHHAASAISDR